MNRIVSESTARPYLLLATLLRRARTHFLEEGALFWTTELDLKSLGVGRGQGRERGASEDVGIAQPGMVVRSGRSMPTGSMNTRPTKTIRKPEPSTFVTGSSSWLAPPKRGGWIALDVDNRERRRRTDHGRIGTLELITSAFI
jgi:hypothetical protein